MDIIKRFLGAFFMLVIFGSGMLSIIGSGGGGGEGGTDNQNLTAIEIENPTPEEFFSTDCNEIWVSGETNYPAPRWGGIRIEWENQTENGFLQGVGQTSVNTCTGWFWGYTWDYACDAGWWASIPLRLGDNIITITAVESVDSIETVIGRDTITVNKPVMSYSIKGGISNIGSAELWDVRVKIDALGSYAYTDWDGNYELKCLRNGTYSVVPYSYGFYSPDYRFHTYMDWPFTPDGSLVTINNSDVDGQDFSTEVYEVSGTIKNQAGYGFQNLDVFITGADNASASAMTDENGIYSFLVPNGAYTIQPSTYFSFIPSVRSIEVNGGGMYLQDFSSN